MPGPAYHGWTHHPTKGTDPILLEAAASSGVAWAQTDHDLVSLGASGAGIPMDVGVFTTNDATVFDVATRSVFGADHTGVRFLKDGVYLIWAGCNGNNATAGDRIVHYFSGGGALQGYYIGQDRVAYPSPGFTVHYGFGWMQAHEVSTLAPAPTDAMVFYGQNVDAGGGDQSGVTFYVYLGPGTLF